MSGINRGLKALQRTLNSDARKRAWHYVDAKDLVVGRLASSIVPLLTGKYRPDYSPHIDTGDYVVVCSCAALVFIHLLRPLRLCAHKFVATLGCQHFQAKVHKRENEDENVLLAHWASWWFKDDVSRRVETKGQRQ